MAVTLDLLRRTLGPLSRRIRLIVSRGVLSHDADDSKAAQRVDLDLLADEQREGIYRVQQYGLTSRPPAGSEAVCLACGGVREHLVAIAVDDTSNRPTGLDVGEVALWMREHGLRVKCRNNGTVEIGTEPSDFVALASLVKAEHDAIKADLDALKDWVGSFAGTYSGTIDPSTGAASGMLTSTTPVALSWQPAEVAAEEVKAK
ncbi:MAG: phage baseplate assembly protein [Myxococcales bacterium]|jgi:phage gp45-like|nr:phage baseplate assembly protein [Myxococcales bacterium]